MLYLLILQDAYQRLLKFLCPSVLPTEADPTKNKLLQLIYLYQRVYDVSIEAWNQCRYEGEAAENQWFEEQFNLIDRKTLLASIMPSHHSYEGSTSILASYLSKIFENLEKGAELEDHMPCREEDILKITLIHEKRFKDFYFESDESKKLTNHLKMGNSPWRKLQEIDNFQLLYQVRRQNNFSPKINELIDKRLAEIANEPEHELYVIMIKSHQFLNEHKNRDKNTKHEVAKLLEVAKKNPKFYLWEAVFLRNEAKHQLFCNNFEEAERLFRDALNACSIRNYGTLRGEIARDAFALAVSNQRLIPENHEIYYRNLINFIEVKGEPPNIEETAVEMSEHFWNVLYKPYPSEVTIKPMLLKPIDIQKTTELVLREDWVNFRSWIKFNKERKDKRLTDVRGNTFLMNMIKITHNIPSMNIRVEIKEKIQHTNKQAIKIIIEEFPKLINISDCKGQTPLMLASHFADKGLVKILLDAGADTNLKDFKGRTALHAACASRSFDCALLLLEHGGIIIKKPEDDKDTRNSKSSILHTAAKMGHPAIVKKIVELYPELVNGKDINEQTPLDIVNMTLTNLDQARQFWLTNHDRMIGSREEYLEIQSLLMSQSF